MINELNPNWKAALDLANAAPRCGARRKHDGLPCQRPAMANGRCWSTVVLALDHEPLQVSNAAAMRD